MAAFVLGAAPAGAEAPGPPPDFTWSVPDHMTQGEGKGSVGQYATPPSEVKDRRWPVDFQVRPAACHPGASYRWTIGGKEAPFKLTEDCQFRFGFPEGAYQVGFEVTTPRGTSTSSATVVVQDWLIVSLGDSVASGEGNPDVPAKRGRGAKWANRRCHRSSKAGTAQAALRLEQDDPTTSVTFVHLACSGATIEKEPTIKEGPEKVLIPHPEGALPRNANESPPQNKLPPQVDELAKVAAVRPVDAVLLSIGANDVNFGPMSMFCIKVWRCMHRRFDPLHPLRGPFRNRLLNRRSETLAQVEAKALKALPHRYQHLQHYMEQKLPAPRPPVYIVQYFDPTIGPHGFCRIAGISQREAKWAHDYVLAPLNRTIRKAARRWGWTLVGGVAKAFRGHGYCAGKGQRWIRTFLESLRLHGFSKPKAAAGTLHPNELGHKGTAELIDKKLGRDLREQGSIPFSSGRDTDLPALVALGLAEAGLLGTGFVVWRRRRSAHPLPPPPRGSSRPGLRPDEGRPRRSASGDNAGLQGRAALGLAGAGLLGMWIVAWRRRRRSRRRRPSL